MPSQCCLTFCPNVGTHRFPTDPKMRAKWVKAVGQVLPGLKICPYSRICLDHFKPEEYAFASSCGIQIEGYTTRKRLRRHAVPSIFNFTPRKRIKEEFKEEPSTPPVTEDPLALDVPQATHTSPDNTENQPENTDSKHTLDLQVVVKCEIEEPNSKDTLDLQTVQCEFEEPKVVAASAEEQEKVEDKDCRSKIRLEQVKVTAGPPNSAPKPLPVNHKLRIKERVEQMQLVKPVGLKIDPKAVKKTYSRGARRAQPPQAPAMTFIKTNEGLKMLKKVYVRAANAPSTSSSKRREDPNSSVYGQAIKREPYCEDDRADNTEDSKENVLKFCETNDDRATLLCGRAIKTEPDFEESQANDNYTLVCERDIKVEPRDLEENETDLGDKGNVLIEISIDTSAEVKKEWPDPTYDDDD